MCPPLACLVVSLRSRSSAPSRLLGHLGLLHATGRHDRYRVLLKDSVWRHNVPELGADAAYALSLRLGDEWIAEAKAAIALSGLPVEIVRHDQVRAMADFPVILDRVVGAFTTPPFLAGLEQDLAAFKARAERRGEIAASASADFVIEELAADITLARQEPFTHYYPGPPLRAYAAFVAMAEAVPAAARGLEFCRFREIRNGKTKLYLKDHPLRDAPQGQGISG